MMARNQGTVIAWKRITRFFIVMILVMGVACVAIAPPAVANEAPSSSSAPVRTQQDVTKNDIQVFEALKTQAFESTQRGDFAQAEEDWSQLINLFPESAALWSNRGNVRAGQNKLDEAIADYTQSISLAPQEPDPYLNRGATYEALSQWEKAIADYNQALEIDPENAAAFNNRGNAKGGKGDWQGAIADYTRASELNTNFVLPVVNRALALYQVGETETSIKAIKGLARKYPQFADARAALTAVLWDQGKQGEAESNWVGARGLDRRYRDIEWVAHVRRWPPKVVDALDRFLHLQS
ncbi:MAG: tetratricopeptide repeat protein [Leptolyngbyaceae bacterium]|nr:tetratricopeptide repeat protein [Leptolyngbyaceae bacterium]